MSHVPASFGPSSIPIGRRAMQTPGSSAKSQLLTAPYHKLDALVRTDTSSTTTGSQQPSYVRLELVLMASYPASTESRYDNSYTASIPMGMIYGNNETESNIACGYHYAFPWTLGVHASQPKKSKLGTLNRNLQRRIDKACSRYTLPTFAR
jgi:hypothetical protein